MAARSLFSANRIGVVGACILCSSTGSAWGATFTEEVTTETSSVGLRLVCAHVFVAPGARTPSTRVVDRRGIMHRWCAADTNRGGFGLLPLELVWQSKEGSENVATRYEGAVQLKHRGNALLDELTREGMQQAVLFGRSLRERFTNLFDGNFNWQVLSSSSCGAIDTAHGVSSGFSASSDLQQAKVSVFGPEQHDWLAFPNTPLRTCPALVQIISTSLLTSNERLRETEKGKRVLRQFHDRFRLELNLGQMSESLDSSVEFFQIFRNQVAYELAKTNEASLVRLKSDLDELAADQFFDMISGGKEENRAKTMQLVAGSLVQNLLGSFEVSEERRVQVYSCGDRTLMTLVLCLDPFGTNGTQSTRSWPLDLSDISFELWQDSRDTKYIRIAISGNPIRVPGVPAITPGGYFYTADSIRRHLQEFALQTNLSQLCS